MRNIDSECDKEKMKKMAMQYFFNNFKEDQKIRGHIVSFTYPTYLEDHQVSLFTVPSKLVIKKTLFDMNPHKALGEDGFLALFYQYCWDTMVLTLHHFVNKVWSYTSLFGTVNNTLLIIIPKINHLEFLTRFLPLPFVM